MSNAAPVSMRVADSLAAYRIVRCNGSHQVALSTAAADAIFGVSQDEATKSNQGIPVAVSGIAKVYCNDTITAGALVMSNGAGQAVPAVATTAGVHALGVCLDTVSATGTLAQVLINPFQLDIP